jgi:hypothetical protein
MSVAAELQWLSYQLLLKRAFLRVQGIAVGVCSFESFVGPACTLGAGMISPTKLAMPNANPFVSTCVDSVCANVTVTGMRDLYLGFDVEIVSIF